MNAYDFDETIYDGDSTRDFYFYCVKKFPSVLKFLPYQAFYFALFVFGLITKTQFKEKFYIFFTAVKDIDGAAADFWKSHKSGIKKFYLETKKDDDVIISASPYFLLAPICKNLGIKHLIASDADKLTGKYNGENCWGEEKVKRLKAYDETFEIENFYSDSLSDTPLARLAKKAYIVEGEKLTDWNEYEKTHKKSILKTFLSPEFTAFLIIGCINVLTGVGFSSLFSLFLPANFAFVFGYAVSLTISYFLNTFLAFKEKISFAKYIKFCISYLPNFIIQNIFVVVLYNHLGINKYLVFLLSAILGVPVTFLFLRFFAFAKKEKK